MQAGQEVCSILQLLDHKASPQLKAAERSWSRKAGSSQTLPATILGSPAAHAQPVPADLRILDLARQLQAGHCCHRPCGICVTPRPSMSV